MCFIFSQSQLHLETNALLHIIMQYLIRILKVRNLAIRHTQMEFGVNFPFDDPKYL